jgi:type VI secretion system protein ImpC
MPGNIDLEINLRGEAFGTKSVAQPFNILVLGNFSGQSADPAAAESIAKRKITRVDVDNVDELFSLFTPWLQLLDFSSASIELSPRDLDDFHPDHLFRSLPAFAELRDMRKKLLDPATAHSALDEILSAGAVVEGEIVDEAAGPGSSDPAEDSGLMFERLLGRPASRAEPQGEAVSELRKLDIFIRELVAPHIVHDPDPRVETAIDSVDQATADLMRRILHHADFQALESSWRSLTELVSTLELDEDLRLYVCDIRREELLAGLPDPGAGIGDSALFHLLVERRRQAADDTPWTIIAADYFFGRNAEDIALLTALGAAAAVNGGIFLGGARPAILGCSTTAELADARYWSSSSEDGSLWQSLRTSPVADRIGLALPRVLARLPYGEGTEEIDSFQFEEMPQRSHEDYLWANPAYSCARLLAENFTHQGWAMEPGANVDLGYLPAHHYSEDGEPRLQPCAELLLPESTMVAMLDQGLMPLVSYRNQNTAVLGRFQSIAAPAAALAGPWARR